MIRACEILLFPPLGIVEVPSFLQKAFQLSFPLSLHKKKEKCANAAAAIFSKTFQILFHNLREGNFLHVLMTIIFMGSSSG